MVRLSSFTTTIFAAIFLSTAVTADLMDCGSRSDGFEYYDVEYPDPAQRNSQICVKITGNLRDDLPDSAQFTVSLSYNKSKRRWTVPLYLSMDPADQVTWPIPAGADEIRPCFYLPPEFLDMKPYSKVNVRLETEYIAGGRRAFCVDGYLKFE